jgi:hypothetical protein
VTSELYLESPERDGNWLGTRAGFGSHVLDMTVSRWSLTRKVREIGRGEEGAIGLDGEKELRIYASTSMVAERSCVERDRQRTSKQLREAR